MHSFTAIDFETASQAATSICQVGLVRVQDGKIVREMNLLVQPPRNYYRYNFIRIHGISPEKTAFSPSFHDIWQDMEPYIRGQHVVAHNASFDIHCLKQSLAFYHIEEPPFKSHCTYRIYKKGLAALCKEYEIDLRHHDAASDARACALLFLKHMQENKQGLF